MKKRFDLPSSSLTGYGSNVTTEVGIPCSLQRCLGATTEDHRAAGQRTDDFDAAGGEANRHPDRREMKGNGYRRSSRDYCVGGFPFCAANLYLHTTKSFGSLQ